MGLDSRWQMKRLTTPTHEFIFEVNPNEWDAFRITYKQAGKIILERTEADNYKIEERQGTNSIKYKLSYRLSQVETQKFQANVKTEIQIRCHYPDGSSFASDVIPLNVAEVLNQEILGDDIDD